MRKHYSVVRLADILVIALVAILFPFSPLTPYHCHRPHGIPDKVESYYHPRLTTDSLHSALRHVESEKEEIAYYLRVHNVTDEGYDMVARYNEVLRQKHIRLLHDLDNGGKSHVNGKRIITGSRRIAAKDRPLIAVKTAGGYWRGGHFYVGTLRGKGVVRDRLGRIVSAVFDADTVVFGIRHDSTGLYQGQMDRYCLAAGQGVKEESGGCHLEGFWRDDRMHGFGFDSSPLHALRIGEWKEGRYLGERMKYTHDRIYGIDISRHQHEKGRKRYAINWKQLRITSLGKRHQNDGNSFPVSFLYIKATEGNTIRNRYYRSDYLQAIRTNIHVGAYHFFSLSSPAVAQARYFLGNAGVRKEDLPPVLDVEPTEQRIKQIGGDDELLKRIRTWLRIVEEHTGKRPILYVSQMFVNRHMRNADDIKQRYNIWIARYGQYRPDIKLVYWQFCSDGRVEGIKGDVDINVFNGYQTQFDDFVRTGLYK